MKKQILISCLLLVGLVAFAAKVVPYKDKSLPVGTRVSDLLSRMTLEEKVGQTLCLLGWESYDISRDKKQGKKGKRQVSRHISSGATVSVSEKFKHEVDSLHVGAYGVSIVLILGRKRHY